MTPLAVTAATANPHKLSELLELLGDRVLLSPRPADLADVEENAADLLGNARLKATAVSTATGGAALADDTGLEVDALHGAPGVHSARFAGPDATDADNRAKLLAALADTAEEQRTARFRTVVVLCGPTGELSGAGVVEGRIARTERGEQGFGYDSVFIPNEGDGRTFAEMTPAEKHAISHRSRAVESLVALLDASGLNADHPQPGEGAT